MTRYSSRNVNLRRAIFLCQCCNHGVSLACIPYKCEFWKPICGKRKINYGSKVEEHSVSIIANSF